MAVFLRLIHKKIHQSEKMRWWDQRETPPKLCAEVVSVTALGHRDLPSGHPSRTVRFASGSPAVPASIPTPWFLHRLWKLPLPAQLGASQVIPHNSTSRSRNAFLLRRDSHSMELCCNGSPHTCTGGIKVLELPGFCLRSSNETASVDMYSL